MNTDIKKLVSILTEGSDLFSDIEDEIDDINSEDLSNTITTGVIGYKPEWLDNLMSASLPQLKHGIIKISQLAKFPVGVYKFTDKKQSTRDKKFKKLISRLFDGFYRQIDKDNPLNLNWIDTSNISDFTDLFLSVPVRTLYMTIDMWDTSSVTNMSQLFRFFNNIPDISSWNVENVENMSYMFYRSAATNIVDTSKWKTSSLINIDHMFEEAEKVILDMNNFDLTYVKSLNYTFCKCKDIPGNLINNMNTSLIKLMKRTFENANMKNVGKLNWNTLHLLLMEQTFYHVDMSNVDISGWNTNVVNTMEEAFYASDFSGNETVLDNWNVETVKIMKNIFKNIKYETPLLLTNWNIKQPYAYKNNEYCENLLLPRFKERTDEIPIEEIIAYMTYVKSLVNEMGERKQTTLIKSPFKGLKLKIVHDE